MKKAQQIVKNIFLVLLNFAGLAVLALILWTLIYFTFILAKDFPVKKEKQEEIIHFVSSLYSNTLDSYSDPDNNVGKYFHDSYIFRLQRIGSYVNSDSTDKEDVFYELYKTFREDSGKRYEIKTYEVRFMPAPYDLGVADVYHVTFNVEYENLLTAESFLLKETETGWKMVRFNITIKELKQAITEENDA